MTISSDSTEAALDRVVAGVPGVSALYRTGGMVGHVVAVGKGLLHTTGETVPYVQLTEADAQLSVTVTIGVGGSSAVDACRSVHDAIASWLRVHGYPDFAITITVAHVVS